MPPTVEFFFDLSSPWTRIAFHNITRVLADTGAQITWRPILVGAVFNAVNREVYAARANADSPRMKLSNQWLHEWAELAGVAMNFPSAHHPLKSVSAMRFCCVIEDDQQALYRFSETAFEAYFRDQQNLDDPAVLVRIANRCGLDGEDIARRSVLDGNKARLRSNTQEAIDRGAFGSPTLFVGGDHMYFGNDQLPLVKKRVLARG
jgi:2-hydroxychromene-2-carboxylate isomerase